MHVDHFRHLTEQAAKQAFQFVTVSKLKDPAKTTLALKHNLREEAKAIGPDGAIRIDAGRKHLNKTLRGPATAKEGKARERELLTAAGIDPACLRKDAVRLLEILVSLPADYQGESTDYFEDAVAWFEAHYGAPVLSAVIHLDEAAPHIHILILPLVNGRMVGSDLVGSPGKQQAMYGQFHSDVSSRYGLELKDAQSRMSYSERQLAVDRIVQTLMRHPNRIDCPALRKVLSDALCRNADQLISEITAQDETNIGFVALENCAPTDAESTAKADEIVAQIPSESIKPIPVGGFTSPDGPILPDASSALLLQPCRSVNSCHSVNQVEEAAASDECDDGWQRVSDDMSSNSWSSDLDEFIRPPAKHSKKQLFVASVNAALLQLRQRRLEQSRESPPVGLQ